MSLSPPEPPLMNFQNIVDKVRKDIATYCPEWTDYNLSDPGITLIELFAWMTTMLGYRVNQIPQRNYIKFLELLGTRPAPPKQATTELTFYLSTPFPTTRPDDEYDNNINTKVPGGTEVATRRATAQDPEIIFTTDQLLTIASPKLIHVRRDVGDSFDHNYLQPPKAGTEIYDFSEKTKRTGFAVFRQKPKQDEDTFYLGFSADVSGYLLRLKFLCQKGAGGTGIDGNNPPLIWECGMGDDHAKDEIWQEATWDKDNTQGLNRDGEIELYLPLSMKETSAHGIQSYWIRCRVSSKKGQGAYTSSPIIKDIKPFVLGAKTAATHSAQKPKVELGESNGDPDLSFTIPGAPILPLDSERGEFIQVEEEDQEDGTIKWVSWQEVKDFSQSSRYDKHFTLDIGNGEVRFGPSIRQPEGGAQQYGAIPPLRQKIQITRYRTGGGVEGNVPRGSLRVLKKTISYVVDVTNWQSASGGANQESIEAARLRTQGELQTQERAVTAEDYERLAQKFEYIARLKCMEQPDSPGEVTLLVVPEPTLEIEENSDKDIETDTPSEDNQQLEDLEKKRVYDFLASLEITTDIKNQIRKDFDKYRVLGTIIQVKEPKYQVVKIETQVQCWAVSSQDEVKKKIIAALKDFITPLPLNGTLPQHEKKPNVADDKGPDDSGDKEQSEQQPWQWEFGRNLYRSDIFNKIQEVPGVKHISAVNLYWGALSPKEALAIGVADDIPWQKADDGVVEVADENLLYLIEHQIEVSPDEPAG